MKKAVVLVFCIALLLLSAIPTASAKADFEMVAQYGTPTVDGVISEGEYAAESTYVMNAESASAWVGEVGESFVTWYFAWDEGGLYYAGTINDTTPSYRGEDGYWVGIDCLEIAINPAHAIPANDSNEGIFFSFGATKAGKIVAWRHNYLDGLVSDEITGAAKGHKKGSDSYTIEVYIPWSLVRMETDCTIGGKTDLHIDTTAFVPQNGAVLGVLPCAIDADESENILAAYKFNGTDFLVKDFVNLTLAGKPEPTQTEQTSEEVTIQAPLAEQPTQTPASENETEAQSGGCGAILGSVGVIALLPFAALLRKKNDKESFS
ncbi:MAG: hypothetical protein IJW70_03290 [Clostridia bacterium]|nr:hypothetical protein [Clostridia bacterium]